METNTKYNFTSAENETFSWNYFDGTNGDTLTHKASGRDIYQMCWLVKGKMTDRVDDETRKLAKAFWAELEVLKEQKPPRVDRIEADPEPKHGENGYCRKCHSYCYGDCQS